MKIDTFPHFVFGFWRHEKLPSFGKFRWPAEIFLFFLRRCYASTSCTLPQSAIPPYRAGAEIWAVGFLFCGEQPLNILEVVGLRAPTAVAECHRHSAKSRLSLRMERALRSGRWDSICCGKQPLNILEVVGLRAPTAVETCHWHVSKSRLSNPTFGVKNKDHPDGWSLFWRRRWDSNPRGVLPPTRFRVELVMTTSILLRIAPVLQALIYSIMQ